MSEKAVKNKDKILATILAIFLGTFGVHRFYLRKWWGIFYILFCWTGIPTFIGVIEGLVFICTNDVDWDNKYNGGVHTNSDNTATIITIAVCAFCFIPLVGIIAAIAIPAYVEYTSRAGAAVAGQTINQVEAAVSSYVTQNNKNPATIAEAGFSGQLPPNIKSIAIDPQTGSLTFVLKTSSKQDQALVFNPEMDAQKNIQWTCVPGDIIARYLPPQCRQAKATK